MPQITVLGVIKFLAVVASIVYSQRQAKKLKKSLRSLGNTQGEATGRLQTRRDSAGYKQVIYGRVRVGGTIILNHNTTTSVANDTKHIVVEMADHEVESFSDLMFDDEVVPINSSGNATGRFAGYVQAHYYYGGPAQAALAPLITNCPDVWDADHKLLGSAGVYVRLFMNQDLFPNGVPNITAICRGKKVYDPRTDLTAWSDNPALCLADYYCDQKRGLAFDYYSEIDEAELIASTNVCDELVTLADASTEKRYTCNGAFTCDTIHADVTDQLKASMAGFVIDPPGRVAIVAGYWRPATLPAFDENMLVAGLTVTTKTPITENCNRVKGMYISPENSWQATDYPQVVNALYLSEDNNKEAYREINYTFVTSSAQAQRMGKIAMEEARQGISVQGVGNFAWFQVRAGDVIKFSNTRRGWVEKLFFVEEIGIENSDGGLVQFTFTLRETAAGVYDWANGEETTVDLAPNTNLPSPFNIATPSNLTVLSDNTTREYDATLGQYIQRILVTWTLPNDAMVQNGGTIRLQYRKVGDTLWKDWAPLGGTITQDYIFPVVTGESYVARIRSQRRFGGSSVWIYSDPTTPSGDSTPPAAPTGFTAAGGVNGIYLSWTNPADADLAFIDIYEHTANTPAPNAGSTPLVSVGDEDSSGIIDITYFRSGLAAGVTRYYWIRAVDSSGNKSAWVGPQGATSATELSAYVSPAYATETGYAGSTVVDIDYLFAITIGGVAPFSYLWQASIGGVWTNTVHTNANPLFRYSSATPTIITDYLRCRVTDSSGSIAYTQTLTIVVEFIAS